MQLKLRAVPLSEEVTKFLQDNEKRFKDFRECKLRSIYHLSTSNYSAKTEEDQWKAFHDQLVEKAKKSLVGYKGTWWQRKTEADIEELFDHIWTFGPNRAKFNILFNAIPDYDRKSKKIHECE